MSLTGTFDARELKSVSRGPEMPRSLINILCERWLVWLLRGENEDSFVMSALVDRSCQCVREDRSVVRPVGEETI